MSTQNPRSEKFRNITLPPDLEASAPLLNEIDEEELLTSEVHDKIYSFAYQCLQHMQDTKQNLSTVEFLDFLLDKLKISASDCFAYDVNYVFMEVANHHFGKEQCSRFKNNKTDLDDLIYKWLYFNQEYCPELYRNKIAVLMDKPTVSLLDPKKIAVWRNTSKMTSFDKRVTISVRKWIKSTLVGLSDEQIEELASLLDITLTPFDEFGVRFHDSYDFWGWNRAYGSNKITSCMSLGSSCEVGRSGTFTCYCTGYHGLPDNGLKLAVLYQDDIPVARAITFTDGNIKCYVANYGDDRLLKWLRFNGYIQSSLPRLTMLYSTMMKLKPHVDGHMCRADHCRTSYGIYYWELREDGRYGLGNSNALAEKFIKCECCGGVFDEHRGEIDLSLSEVDGEHYYACEDCFDKNKFYIYCGNCWPESFFFHNGMEPSENKHIVKYKDRYYQRHALSDYNLVEIDGEIYCADDL